MSQHTQHVSNGGLSRRGQTSYRTRRTAKGLWIVERVRRSDTGKLTVQTCGWFPSEREAEEVARGLSKGPGNEVTND